MKIIKDCLTGLDGETYDPSRVYLGMAVISALGLQISAVVVNKQPFDMNAFGIGFGALLAGGGLGVAAKSKTEPSA